MTATEESEAGIWSVLQSYRLGLALVIGFSCLYFTETLIRASEKTFWFDELCTLDICRLPTFQAAWAAVLHGVDYNPPLFYLIERLSRQLFGEGLIAMRLPAMIGFWILCLSLYRFVYKRGGPIAGWIAMVLPMLTGAYFYAYEARPHGIVLGFCGAALLCWDAAEQDGSWRHVWLAAFAVFLGAAFFTHCYAPVIAIPFVFVELVRSIRFRAIRPARWIAFAVPTAVAVIPFIPLLDSYRANIAITNFNDLFAPNFAQVTAFYVLLLGPCILLLLCVFVLIGLERSGLLASSFGAKSRNSITLSDTILVFGFLAIPVYGILLAKAVNGPFFARYFMSAVVGVGLLMGFVTKPRRRRSWGTLVVALVIAGVIIAQCSTVITDRVHLEGEPLNEPSTGLLMNTAVDKPLETHTMLVSNAGPSLPIVVVYQLDFLYLVHYWPSAVPRLYSVTGAKGELQYRLYSEVRQWCHIPYNPPEIFNEFLPLHHDFLLYGNSEYLWRITELMSKGVEVKSVRFGDHGHFLAEMHVK